MISHLEAWAAERGYRLVCGGVEAVSAARADLDRQRRTELDASFYRAYLSSFGYARTAQAVIAIAMPRPAHRVTFELDGGPFAVTLPPTYLRYRPLFEEVRDNLTSAIPELRGHLEILAGPLKSVACRLGLVSYGLNNVTYIPEFGSYFQLLAYTTDLSIGLPAGWTPAPLRLMDECENCGVCGAVCPTGAINDGRVLLHAEACTTLFSEQAGELEHYLSADCLFGCLECQRSCPANAGLFRVESSGVTFDRPETSFLLGAGKDPAGAIAASVARKLALLGLAEQDLIARNLAQLIARRAPAH